MPTRILFVCSQNRFRSPTAADIFARYAGVETMSAGTNKDCETPVSSDLIEWANVILVMEDSHRRVLTNRFNKLLKGKKLAVLEIPDLFPYMDAMLIALLKARVTRYVRIDPDDDESS